MLVITYKALNGLGSGFLMDCITPWEPSWLLISSVEALLSVPPRSQALCLVRRTQERAFSAAVLWLGNAWPEKARLTPVPFVLLLSGCCTSVLTVVNHFGSPYGEKVDL